MSIKENNKLIAEVMGWEVGLHSGREVEHCVQGQLETHKKVVGGSLSFQNMKYHFSWDWLMPVVEKIASTDCSKVDIHTGTGCTDSFSWCDIEWYDGKNKFLTSDKINQDEQNPLTATYRAVVEFIKWYNKQH